MKSCTAKLCDTFYILFVVLVKFNLSHRDIYQYKLTLFYISNLNQVKVVNGIGESEWSKNVATKTIDTGTKLINTHKLR